MILPISFDNPEQSLIKKVVDILEKGGVIAYPTDTVYGIGCDILNKDAVDRVIEIKQRDGKKPLSVMFADVLSIVEYAVITPQIDFILNRFLPGAYTFILEAKEKLPLFLRENRKTVGVRVPDNKICANILKCLSSPIISTSANISGEPTFVSSAEIEKKIGRYADIIIDGGILSSAPSSIIDLTAQKPMVLRSGKGDVKFFSANC